MKRRYLLLFALFVAVMVFTASLASAQETGVTGSLVFRNDTCVTEHSNNSAKALLFRAEYEKWGIYSESKVNGQKDYEQYKFAVSRKLFKASDSSADLLVGISTDNSGTDLAYTRLWLSKKYGKADFFADLGGYAGMKNQKESNFEGFWRIKYQIFGKLSVGLEGDLIYWPDKDLEYVMLGPAVYLELAKFKEAGAEKRVVVAFRYSHDWLNLDTGMEQTNGLRFDVGYLY